MFDVWWFSYPLLGAFVGFFAGLLGVGGGAIIVPILTSLFMAQGFSKDHVVHLALGTSMASIVLTSISSLRAHHLHGAVRWDIFKQITPSILIGTFSGTFLAALVNTNVLAIFFVIFMSFVSLRLLINIKPVPSRGLPGPLGMFGVGLGIGGISSLVAIGGGSMTIPFMIRCNVVVHDAIGTSAAIGLPIALAGTLGYFINGGSVEGTPQYSIGYIYLPALIFIAIFSMVFAPIGVKLAHRLPVMALKKIFAGLLLILCIKMLHSLFF